MKYINKKNRATNGFPHFIPRRKSKKPKIDAVKPASTESFVNGWMSCLRLLMSEKPSEKIYLDCNEKPHKLYGEAWATTLQHCIRTSSAYVDYVRTITRMDSTEEEANDLIKAIKIAKIDPNEEEQS